MTATEIEAVVCWNHERLANDDLQEGRQVVLATAHPRHTPCCSSHDRPLCCECYCKLHFVEIHKCSPAFHATAEALVRVDAYLGAVPTLYDEENPMPEGLVLDTVTNWAEENPIRTNSYDLTYADLVLLVDHLKGAHDHH